MNWLPSTSIPLSASSLPKKREETRAEAATLLLAIAIASVVITSGCTSPTSSTTTKAPKLQATEAAESERSITVTHPPDVSIAQLRNISKGMLLKQLTFDDKDGHGLLLLSRSEEAFKNGTTEEPLNRIILHAEQFVRTSADAPWTSRWKVEQTYSCEGLDLEASYFLEQTQATDLDADGRVELTFASYSFCGGGIDPQQLRIDVRQGDEEHYVVNGDSLVEVEGDPPFGGERHDGPGVDRAPASIRKHLDKVWNAIKHGSN